MASLVLRWRVPPDPFQLRFAAQPAPPGPIATIIGPSGRDGAPGPAGEAILPSVIRGGNF